MSNDVRGYIQGFSEKNISHSIKLIEEKYNIGIGMISCDELYNFPEFFLPRGYDNRFAFIIGDDAEDFCASYLIDYLEYAPEADIGFPVGARNRLNILLDSLSDMIKVSGALKMVVAITDSNQIETIKRIKLSELYQVIHADFEEYQAPPDTLYEIIV